MSRYSVIYVERGEPIADSARLRRRVAAAQPIAGMSNFLERKLGIPVYEKGRGLIHNSFFEAGELRDVFDYISLTVEFIRSQNATYRLAPFLQEMKAIFDEENSSFWVDDAGVVRPRIDAAFQVESDYAIAALKADRYANVRGQFDLCERALSHANPDYKQAVRFVFTACEALFRLMCERAPRLGNKEAKEFLPPLLDRAYGGDATARRTSGRMLNSFAEWIDAAHNYRHEQGHEEPTQPPEALAIALISSGTSHLRWLARLDQGVG